MGKTYKGQRYALTSSVACLSLLISGHAAYAFNYTFDNGVVVRFDNTIQYSLTERTAPESSVFANDPNTNDGDNNLRAGIVSNRLDLITTLDLSDHGYGVDVSAESFYDTIYNQNTQNGSGSTYNPAQQPFSKFTSATQTQAGRNIELRNLFVYGANSFGGVPITVRVGRLVNLFGESLLFAANGISYGQAPIDIARAISVPNTEAKNLFLPVGQALISGQLTDSVSVSAYYQFEWEKFNFIPNGSYFSPQDLFDAGGQRIYAGPFIPGSALYFYRSKDISGSSTGQFGASLHYDPEGSSWDFGFYALQYNDSEPQVYTNLKVGRPTFVPGTALGSPTAFSLGTYQTVYADGIQIYGVSTSTTFGPLNLAAEASIRANEDLRSTVTVFPGQTPGNNEHNALYAIGDVAHYQISEIYLGPKIPRLWDSSQVIGEAAGENLFAITKNKQNFDTADSQHAALGVRVIGSATYYQALSGLDVSPTIGLGWDFMGKSPDTDAFNGTGIDRGGDITVGVDGTFLNKWTGGINYTYYIAPPGRDPFADRDFVSLNIERTF